MTNWDEENFFKDLLGLFEGESEQNICRQHTYGQKENRITCDELACQIVPILQDYFNGNFTIAKNTIHICFNNGEHFNLTLEKCGA